MFWLRGADRKWKGLEQEHIHVSKHEIKAVVFGKQDAGGDLSCGDKKLSALFSRIHCVHVLQRQKWKSVLKFRLPYFVILWEFTKIPNKLQNYYKCPSPIWISGLSRQIAVWDSSQKQRKSGRSGSEQNLSRKPALSTNLPLDGEQEQCGR